MKTTILTACSVMFLVAGPAAAADFQLTVNVIGNGTAEPNGGTYEDGTVIAIQIHPEPGHLLKSWAGTDDDSSTELTNTVTMDSDRTVTVELIGGIVVSKPVEYAKACIYPLLSLLDVSKLCLQKKASG